MRVVGLLASLGLLACGASTSPPADDTGSESQMESSDDASELGTGTTETELSTGDEDGSDTGEPDLLPTRPSVCDPFEAADCEADEKCVPYDDDGAEGWDSWRCVDAGSDPALEGCMGPAVASGPARNDSCEAGLLCSDFSGPESDEGWCARICDYAHPCDPAESCLPAPEGFFSWCRPQCDPLEDPSSCPGNALACSFGIEAEFVCNQPINVDGQQGEACQLPTECAYGLTCLSGAVVGPAACGAHAACCTALCDASAPDCPMQAPTCTPIFGDAAEPGFESLGFCGD